MGKGRKKASNTETNGRTANGAACNGPDKSVKFTPSAGESLNGNDEDYLKPSGKGMKPSPSMATLNRLDREQIVIYRRPHIVVWYFLNELIAMAHDLAISLTNYKLLVAVISVIVGGLTAGYFTPGDHQEFILHFEKYARYYIEWLVLGVLSSIGFGSGLHTFLIYLAPYSIRVTMATYECETLQLPSFPFDVVCPEGTYEKEEVTVWKIWTQMLMIPTLCWGMGTAIGELPPYFFARAARLSGEEPDDEEYREFLAEIQGEKKESDSSFFGKWLTKGKQLMEHSVVSAGFWGILIFASVPNPLFDLAGMVCGHFLVPFPIFFGATLVGKAIIKAQTQIVFVIFLFAGNHVELLVDELGLIPYIGKWIQGPIREFVDQRKKSLHHGHVDESNLLGTLINCMVVLMVVVFVISIVHSVAQNYHKRLCDAKTAKNK